MPLTRSVVVAMCAVPGEPSVADRWLVSRLGISICVGAILGGKPSAQQLAAWRREVVYNMNKNANANVAAAPGWSERKKKQASRRKSTL